MEPIDVGLTNSSKFLAFPTVIKERCVIQFKIHCNSHKFNPSYTFTLYEYNTFGEPTKRLRMSGTYQRGYTIGFDMIKDYFTKDDRRYALILTIYDSNNNEIEEVVYIESRYKREIQQNKRRKIEQRRVSKRSGRRGSRR
ncbi:hypothetical protein LCGC14_2082240 [marine sediment metagenome]|uniref:Uncharacterized protein n=1 Tax=marine sediment metagenome TaxID=412755 RepID=A0A0F9GTJ5_9ZZZZ